MKELQVTCTLSEIMGRHRISQSAMATASGLCVGTVGAIYHDRTEAISKATLAKLIGGLRTLTGRPYGVGDLFQLNSLK